MISIHDLSFAYPSANKPTLKHINLQVKEGTIFGLLGPNGAGKSTLIHLLSGLLRPQSGELAINGLNLANNKKAVQPIMALVPQDFAFYPQLSARENLHFFAAARRIPSREIAKEVERCIHLAQLEQYADKASSTYSGGLKRRLNLAIGLLNQPKLIFLDEPTVGVDAQSRRFLLENIKQLKQEGMTIVYTSHYMEEVQQLCEDIAIIDHGEIQFSGSIDDLRQCTENAAFHITLDKPLTSHAQSSLCAEFKHLLYQSNSLSLVLQDANQQSIAQLLLALNNMAIQIVEMQFGHKRSLEEIYLQLTQHQLRD